MRYMWLVLCGLVACQAGTRLTVKDDPAPPVREDWSRYTAETLFEKAARFIEEEKPQHAVDAFEYITMHHPQFPRAIDAWLSMGKIYADQFHEYPHAMDMFTKVIKLYPDSAATAQAYFMLGFINSNYVQNLDEARRYYQAFLEKYSQHELVPSVKFELENLGRNADEILAPGDSTLAPN